MLLSQFFRHVFLTRRYVKPLTESTYRTCINRLNDWHGKSVLLSQLTPDLLRQFLRDYREKHSNASVNQKRRTLMILWRFAYRYGCIDRRCPEDWEIPKLPDPQREPEAWTIDELGRIIAACVVARTVKKNGKLWDSRHWQALFLAIYDTGCRIDELLKTARNDLAHTGHLKVRGEHRKGSTRDIIRKLHADTMNVVRTFPPHPLLFPWPIAKRTLWLDVNPILDAAGLPVNRRTKFHCVRRTSATHVCAALGLAKASEHMDHGDLNTTKKFYIDKAQQPDVFAADSIQRPKSA